jgi:CRP/FNR family transcriptional regulator
MLQRPTGVVEPLPLVILRAGHAAARQHEPAPGLWIVETGVLRASVVSAEGRELIVDLLGPGDLAGEPDRRIAPCTLRAVGPARLRAISPERGAGRLAERAARAAALACDLAWLDVRSRILVRMTDLARRLGRPVPGGRLIPLTLSQEDLAALAGTSRESANRAIMALLQQGRLRRQRRGRYTVLDPVRAVR